jgi:ABC-type glycerol-3-phosphate transport system substrate-binding protein
MKGDMEMAGNKWIIGLLTLLILSLVVAGCATPTAAPVQESKSEEQVTKSEEQVTKSEEQVTKSEEQVSKSEGPVVVQYWSNGWFPSSIGGRKALVDKFNKEYEGRIKVDYVQGDWGSGDTYVQSGVAAGGGIACIAEWYASGAVDWYRKGWTLDLRPYITPERRALMEEVQWEARTNPDDGAIVMHGTVLSEPLLMLLYNPAHFEAAGIKPATVDNPWSWAELFGNAKYLTLDANGKHLGEDGFDKKKVVQWGYIHRLDSQKVWLDGMYFAQGRTGKPIIREVNGEWGWFMEPNGAEIYEKFLTPIQEGVTPPEAIGLGGGTMEQMFVDGMASIILRPAFAIPIIGDNYPNFKLAAMPAPFDPGDTVFYEAGGEGMVLTKNCKTPEEAAEFMFWLTQAENLVTYAYGNGMLPVNYAALDLEPFKSDPDWDIIRKYLEMADVYTTPFNPNYIEFRDTVLGPTLLQVSEGRMTFAEANEVIQAQAKAILNR